MSTSELQPQHKEFMLIHLVRSPQVIQRATGILDAADFNPDYERHLAIIWACSCDWFSQYHTCIPKMMLIGGTNSRMAGDINWSGEFIQAKVKETIDMCYACEEVELNTVAAIHILQLYLDERKVRPLALAAAANHALPEMISEINRSFAATRLSVADSVDVFDFTREEINAEQLPAVPTGFQPFDYMLNGGPRKRWSIGLLGPIGGGKTMMAVLAALHHVRQNKEHVILFTYEQPIEPEMRERVWTAVTGADRKEIEGKRWSELKPEIQKKLQDAQPIMDKLRIYDFSGGDPNNTMAGGGGMDEVEAAVQHEIRQGRKPGAVIIDWVGEAAIRWQNTKNDTDPKKRTGYIHMIMSQAKQIAARYDVWVLMCHQLNADAGGRGATAELTQYDAADCRMFSALCTACIVINRKGKTDESNGVPQSVAKISNPKSRCGGSGSLWVAVDDVRHQMTFTNREYVLSYGRGEEARLVAKDAPQDTLAGGRINLAINSQLVANAARPPTNPPPPTPAVI